MELVDCLRADQAPLAHKVALRCSTLCRSLRPAVGSRSLQIVPGAAVRTRTEDTARPLMADKSPSAEGRSMAAVAVALDVRGDVEEEEIVHHIVREDRHCTSIESPFLDKSCSSLGRVADSSYACIRPAIANPIASRTWRRF